MKSQMRLGAGVAVLAIAALCPAAASAVSAPSAVGVAAPAKTVDIFTAPNLQSPAFPKNLPYNRPTVSFAQYKADKANRSAGLRPAGLRGPSGPTPQTVTSVTGFDGINQSTAGGSFPPDINGAVGGARTVEITNQHFTVLDKTTHAITADRTLATMTSYTTTGVFDPRIVYDANWGRFVWTAEAFPENSTTQYMFIAASANGSTAGGTYNVYRINMAVCGTGGFWDYPQVGITQDAIVVTGNCFDVNNNYGGAKTFAFAKSRVYNGLGLGYQVFSAPAADSTVTPTISLDQGADAHLLTANGPNDLVFQNPANPGFASGLTTDTLLTGGVTPSSPRLAGQRGCGATSCNLDTSDGRFSADGYSINGSLWGVATYGLSGSGTFATPRWEQWNLGTHAATQGGWAVADGCSDDFNASLAVGTDQSMVLGWTSTDPSSCSNGGTFVRQYVAGRLPGTAANSLTGNINPSTSTTTLTGDFDGNRGFQRWGDTSSVSPDPSPGSSNKFWSWNESVSNANNWGTRVEAVNNQ